MTEKMRKVKNEVKKMVLSAGAPVDSIFREAQTYDDVLYEIDRLLRRARKLNTIYGVPGYSEKTRNDFRRIERFLNNLKVIEEAGGNIEKVTARSYVNRWVMLPEKVAN